MKIAISNQEIYFAGFYILAFIVTLVIVIRNTVKQKIPLRSVLLMLTTVTLLTVIGSRLFTIPAGDWGKVISTGSLAGYERRSATGGLLFGLAGLFFSKRFLRPGLPVINIFAWLIPLGFGIQQIGCFFNGCCFGKPSALPWSVQYPIGTNAHYFQWVHGLIAENAPFSLNVHPVQLYETICLFLITWVVWRTRNNWKKNGSSLIFSLFLYLIIKFSVDFFRESASDFASRAIFDIQPYQLFILLAGVACGIFLIYYEKLQKSRQDPLPLNSPSLKESVVYVISLSVAIYLFRGLFTWFELVALDLIFIPAILLISIHSFRSLSFLRIRLATTTFLVFPLLLIFQSFPQDTTKQRQSVKNFYKNDVKSYQRIDAGISFGNFYSEMRYNPHESECGTVYTSEDYKHELRMGGIGYSKIKKEDKLTTTVGVNIFGGVNRENNLTTFHEESYFIFGIGPYFKYDYNWIGFGLGIDVGNLRWVPLLEVDEDTYNSGTRFFPIMPELYMRVGRQDILDLKYNYGFTSPTAYPVLTHELSIGSGFSIKPEFSLRGGVALDSYAGHWFLSLEGLVHKQWGLNLRYNFGTSIYIYSTNSYYYNGWLQVGANYRFGFKN